MFIFKYFDNSKDSIKFDINEIKKLKIISPKETIESVKQYATVQIKKADFGQMAQNVKFIFLKPIELKKNINFNEIKKVTIEDIKSFQNILFKPPYSHRLIVI